MYVCVCVHILQYPVKQYNRTESGDTYVEERLNLTLGMHSYYVLWKAEPVHCLCL